MSETAVWIRMLLQEWRVGKIEISGGSEGLTHKSWSSCRI
jgi:hypothetical protein